MAEHQIGVAGADGELVHEAVDAALAVLLHLDLAVQAAHLGEPADKQPFDLYREVEGLIRRGHRLPLSFMSRSLVSRSLSLAASATQRCRSLWSSHTIS